MSYPPARYLGESGESTGVLRPAVQEPDLVMSPGGTQVHYLSTGASTNGAFGLYRWEMGPKPGGASPHFHRTITESFYVLSGSVRLYNGVTWTDGTPGDFLYVPEGGIHAFRNESGAAGDDVDPVHAGSAARGLLRGARRHQNQRPAAQRRGVDRAVPTPRPVHGLMPDFPEEPIYQQLARIGKALSNPVRLRLLDVLDQRERTVEELSEEAGVALKNTSAQLQQLRAAHLVTSRKDGTRVYYRLADERVSRFLGQFQGFAHERLADLRDAVEERLGSFEAVTAAELAARLREPDTVVVDVRSAAAYAEGHVPGAVSVPLKELLDRLGELPGDAEIIAYCGGPYCVVSPRAVEVLRSHGYRARPLDGGLTGWRRSGRAVQESP